MLFSEYMEFYLFEEALSDMQVSLTDYQKQQFIDYYELLIEKNKVMNLTAITEFKEVILRHFIDSLSITNAYKLNSEKILDVGTGAGFPGIPIKIVYPNTEITLLDSLNKRLIFLNEVIQKLELGKISTIHGRAEDFGNSQYYRESFDICVSRAVAKMSSLAELCVPFVKKGGYFVSYKSGEIEEELKLSKRAFQILGVKLDKVEVFQLPGTDIQRSLVMLLKEKNTPKNYPRNAGKPVKDPL